MDMLDHDSTIGVKFTSDNTTRSFQILFQYNPSDVLIHKNFCVQSLDFSQSQNIGDVHDASDSASEQSFQRWWKPIWEVSIQ